MDCNVSGGSGPNATNIMTVNGAINPDGTIRNFRLFESINRSLSESSPVGGVFFSEVDGRAALNDSLVERVDTVNAGITVFMTDFTAAESDGLPSLRLTEGFKSNC